MAFISSTITNNFYSTLCAHFLLFSLEINGQYEDFSTDLRALQKKEFANQILTGFGFETSAGESTLNATRLALRCGFKIIATASVYANFRHIRKAIKEENKTRRIKREDLFIIGRLWNTQHSPHMVIETIQKWISYLGINYFDLYMMHWPVAFKPGKKTYLKIAKEDNVTIEETYHAMEEMVSISAVKYLGLSNFNRSQLARILKNRRIRPRAVEMEIHPYNYPGPFLNYCKRAGFIILATTPFYGDTPKEKNVMKRMFNEPMIKRIAKQLQVTKLQVLLRFMYQLKVVVMVQLKTLKDMKSIDEVYNFYLTEYQMRELKLLNKNLTTKVLTKGKSYREYPIGDIPY